MPWLTNKKTGKPFNTDWIDEDTKQKDRQIAENEKQADVLNDSNMFKDGDTPKSIDSKATYHIKKISLDDSKDSDYGKNSGEDTKAILKGFHYEEIIPGEGMWYKNGATYAFDVKKEK